MYKDYIEQEAQEEVDPTEELEQDLEAYRKMVYMAIHTGIQIPKKLMVYIPRSEMLNGVAKSGIEGYCAEKDLPVDQFQEAYKQAHEWFVGRKPKDDEYKDYISGLIAKNVAELLRRGKLNVSDFLSITTAIQDFKRSGKLIGIGGEIDLSKKVEKPKDFYTKINFPLIDELVGDIADGTILLGAKSGHGKSRMSLALVLHMIETGVVDEVIFYENELTLDAMKMMAHYAQMEYNLVDKNFKIKVQPFNLNELLEEMMVNPNPRRAVVLDSIDLAAEEYSNGDDNRRMAFERMMRIVSTMREIEVDGTPTKLNKYVILTTQLNREAPTGKRKLPNQNHLSESSFKAHYSDLIILFWKREASSDGQYETGDESYVEATCAKTRHTGLVSPSNHVITKFNYRSLRLNSTTQGHEADIY